MANNISDALTSFDAFAELRDGVGINPFKLACTRTAPASLEEIEACWRNGVPAELRQLWLTSRNARLFVDTEYGQWGLALLSPKEAAARTLEFRTARSEDAMPADIVCGELLGDSDLLILSGNGDGILVVLPLDPRSDWYRPAPTLLSFLAQYREALGEKYWEFEIPRAGHQGGQHRG